MSIDQNVESRVAAYRGNPGALQQKYAMGQDLLDLLALQKIKSEKEAAARQMQMQMAQQQAASGQAPMTVAQQREQEVMSMTKDELAKQRGALMQQQQQDQQEETQKLLSGIAQAPGANAAAQPQAMAAGGIVGYAGPDGSVVGEKDPLADDPSLPPRERAMRSVLRAKRDREATAKRVEDIGAAGIANAAQNADVRDLRMRQAATTVPNPYVNVQPTAPDKKVGPAPAPAAAPAQAPQAAVQQTPAVQMIPGVREAIQQEVQRDPYARQADEEKRIAGLMSLTPEHKQYLAEAQAARQKMYNEQYDPERVRQEALSRFLSAAGGRRYNELGAGATAAIDYQNQQRAAKLKELTDLQTSGERPFAAEREATKAGLEGGLKALDAAQKGRSTALSGGVDVYKTEQQARDQDLDRQIEAAKIKAQYALNTEARDARTLQQKTSALSGLQQLLTRNEQIAESEFQKSAGMLLQLQQAGSKLNPAQQQQLDLAQKQRDLKVSQMRNEYMPLIKGLTEQLAGKLPMGGAGGDGFGTLQKVGK